MEISARDLRIRTAEVLRAVQEGEVVTLTYRGRPVAQIHPLDQPAEPALAAADAFGMWRNRDDLKEVRDWVRESRRRRVTRSSSIPTS